MLADHSSAVYFAALQSMRTVEEMERSLVASVEGKPGEDAKKRRLKILTYWNEYSAPTRNPFSTDFSRAIAEMKRSSEYKVKVSI